MEEIADGVNGLFKSRRDSFVVCALRTWEASERRARGFGESSMGGWAGGGDCSAVWKRRRSTFRSEMVVCKVARASFSLKGAISDSDVAPMSGKAHN